MMRNAAARIAETEAEAKAAILHASKLRRSELRDAQQIAFVQASQSRASWAAGLRSAMEFEHLAPDLTANDLRDLADRYEAEVTKARPLLPRERGYVVGLRIIAADREDPFEVST